MKSIKLFILPVFLFACQNILESPKTEIGVSIKPGEWKKIASIPDSGGRTSATSFVLNGKGYVGLGSCSSNWAQRDFWEYSPKEDLWKRIADFGGSGRSAYPISFVIDSIPYVGLGGSPSGIFYDLWAYEKWGTNLRKSSSSASRQWVQKATLTFGNAYYASCFVIGKNAYVLGGADSSGSVQPIVAQYSSAEDKWTRKGNFPGTLRDVANAFTINGKGYFCFGLTQGGTLNDMWEYSAAQDQWTRKKDFPGRGRAVAACFVINDKAYLGLGFDGETDFWSYDPQLDEWKFETNCPASIGWFKVCFVIDGVAYIGSGANDSNFWAYRPK